MREVPPLLAQRLYDAYLSEGDELSEFQVFLCTRFLSFFRKQILERKDFSDLMKFLRSLPTAELPEDTVSRWLSEAYMLQEKDRLGQLEMDDDSLHLAP